MRTRHVVVGLVMVLASAASYGLFQIADASPAMEAIAISSPVMMRVTTVAAHLPAASKPTGFSEFVRSISDSAILLATGVALFAIAAGVRRHTS